MFPQGPLTLRARFAPPRRLVHWLALVVVAAAGAACRPEPPTAATVRRVVDGDTVELADGRLVRYLGIDAPELHRRTLAGWVKDPQPFAQAAAARNEELVRGRQIRLEYEGQTRDRFGRLLAYVSVEGTQVNAVLVSEGLARAWTPRRPSARTEELATLSERARRARRGLWAVKPDREEREGTRR